MSYLPQKTVERFLSTVGNRAVTVTFDKKNGDTTTKNGLPKVFKRRVGGERGAKQGAVNAAHNLRFFDYAQPRVTESGKTLPGFSFDLSKVRELRADGAVLTAK